MAPRHPRCILTLAMARAQPQAIRTDLERKMCLACGHRGRHLQGEKGLITFQCPNCGADLYSRPPRSYAELEGFVAPVTRRIAVSNPPRPLLPAPVKRRARLLERLLVWSIALTLGVITSAGILATLL